MSIKTMRDGDGRSVGVLASFNDQTRELELARRLGEIEQFSGIIGRDPEMLEIYDLIRDVADSNISVLIQGESGTGKELVAAAIHREGQRGNKLFVPVNCGALPEGLLESELFGHVRGAFTGAIRDKKGRFELADGGTIFLDEIGDITPAMQVKLLRVLQEGAFERVGSEKTIHVDVRVVSATNKDLKEEIHKGRFREDLYYRLGVMPILLPPLRERLSDVPLLAEHLLKRYLASGAGRSGMSLSPEAIDLMLSHDWPGNIREMQNWLQFALVKCKGDVILPEHLPVHRSAPSVRPGAPPPPSVKTSRRRKLSREAVEQALSNTGGNKLAAARELGVSRATLYRFLDVEC
jgi:transcriptional regulator with GAF, ATPase, and Fis domain